jgi:hypothetical protein
MHLEIKQVSTLEQQFMFSSALRHKVRNRKYMCSNLHFLLFCIYVRWVSRARNADVRMPKTFFLAGFFDHPKSLEKRPPMGIGGWDRVFGATFSDGSRAQRWANSFRLIWTHRNEVVEIFEGSVRVIHRNGQSPSPRPIRKCHSEQLIWASNGHRKLRSTRRNTPRKAGWEQLHEHYQSEKSLESSFSKMKLLLSNELHFLGQTSAMWPHVAAKVLTNIFIDTFLSDKTARGNRILFESAKNARFATNFVECPTIWCSFLKVRPFVSKSVGYNNTLACMLDHENNQP